MENGHYNKVSHSQLSEEKIDTTHQIREVWQTNLTPDKLGIVSLRPTSLSISS